MCSLIPKMVELGILQPDTIEIDQLREKLQRETYTKTGGITCPPALIFLILEVTRRFPRIGLHSRPNVFFGPSDLIWSCNKQSSTHPRASATNALPDAR
jgi:hypothetical protein